MACGDARARARGRTLRCQSRDPFILEPWHTYVHIHDVQVSLSQKVRRTPEKYCKSNLVGASHFQNLRSGLCFRITTPEFNSGSQSDYNKFWASYLQDSCILKPHLCVMHITSRATQSHLCNSVHIRLHALAHTRSAGRPVQASKRNRSPSS